MTARLAKRTLDALNSRAVGLALLAAALSSLSCSAPDTTDGSLDPQGGCSAGQVLDARSQECAVSKGRDLMSTNGWGIVGDVAVATRGDEGAVVYVEGIVEGEVSRGRVLVQRFDASGTFFGEARELANGPLYGLESVAIAASGEKYLACWASAGDVRCSALGEGLEPTPVLQERGKAVAVVHGSQGWLIAYVTDPLSPPARFVLRRFAHDFEAQSPDRSFSVATEISSSFPVPLLASTDTGFLLVGDDPAQGARAQLYRLDHELNQLGNAIDLGQAFWLSGRMAANANLVVVSLSKPYGSNLILVDEGGVIQSVDIPGGGKMGMHQALLAQNSNLIASWFTTEPTLFTQAFSTGSELPRLPVGTSSNVPLGQSTSAPSKLALVRLSDRVLALYPSQSGRPAVGDTWRAEGISARPLPAD
jgi:hypothetical protein